MDNFEREVIDRLARIEQGIEDKKAGCELHSKLIEKNAEDIKALNKNFWLFTGIITGITFILNLLFKTH